MEFNSGGIAASLAEEEDDGKDDEKSSQGSLHVRHCSVSLATNQLECRLRF